MASRYLHEEAYVDTYLSDHMANVKYPYRMQPVKHASPTTCDESEKHILDSSIGKNFGNDDVIEKAEYLDCDIVVPADVIGDHKKTVDKVLDMLERCEKHGLQTLVPIQGDSPNEYKTNAADMMDTINDHGYQSFVDRYAVGGIKDESTDVQTDCVDAAYSGIEQPVHAFGAGFSPHWIIYIRNNHNKVMSIDMSTPMYAGRANNFIKFNAKHISNEKPRGKHVSFTNARLAEAMMTELNYMICDGPDEDELQEILDKQ